jgi:hypothetical protein
MRFFEVTPFLYELTPGTIADAARTLSGQREDAT